VVVILLERGIEMKPEPLKGKGLYCCGKGLTECDTLQKFDAENMVLNDDIKSAVEGLIKFHEDRIEELIKDVKDFRTVYWEDIILAMIKIEYESIMAIEHWLEDVI